MKIFHEEVIPHHCEFEVELAAQLDEWRGDGIQAGAHTFQCRISLNSRTFYFEYGQSNSLLTDKADRLVLTCIHTYIHTYIHYTTHILNKKNLVKIQYTCTHLEA